jgi:hypothetical protein
LLLRKATRLTITNAPHMSAAMTFPAARRCSCRSPSFPVESAPVGSGETLGGGFQRPQIVRG